MTTLDLLRNNNPQLPILNINDPAFRHYGIVHSQFDSSKIIQTCLDNLQFPETGSLYKASVPELEILPETKILQDLYFGQLPIQCGVCFGLNHFLNALEYHKSSEINIACTDMVLLLADQRDLDQDHRLDSRLVKAFYLEKGDTVELFATTLHFCPCCVQTQFASIVVLPADTNLPLTPQENQTAPLLWAKNKWLIAHEENQGLIQRGAYPGIYHTNWKINPL